ncbi:MAG TPA: EAL domain-containing protein [Desulfosporosinus sp.]
MLLRKGVLKVYESRSLIVKKKAEYLLTGLLIIIFAISIEFFVDSFVAKDLIYSIGDMSFILFCGYAVFSLRKGNLEHSVNIYIFGCILFTSIGEIIRNLLSTEVLTQYNVLLIVTFFVFNYLVISLVSIKRYQLLLIIGLSCLITILDSSIIYLKYYSHQINDTIIIDFITYFLIVFGASIISNSLLKINDEAIKIVDQEKENLQINKDKLEEMVKNRTNELFIMNEKLIALAYTDSLTGLPNRKKIIEDFNLLLNNKVGICAVLFIDIDNFKSVNDNYGHQAGDYVLVKIAERLQKIVRAKDIVGRISGDEFIIILSDIESPINAEKIATKVVQTLSSSFSYNENPILVGASIGISIYPEHGSNVDTLIKNADLAMYEVKHNGGYGYSIYSDEINDNTINKLEMKVKLNKAIENNEFFINYQPIIDLKLMKVISSEALIRWFHDNRVIPPIEFIPIAKNIGEIVTIDNWMLENACIQCKKWHEMGAKNFSISVNTSFKQLKQENFEELILNLLDTHSLPPKYLNIEITEDEAMEDPELIIGKLTQLRSQGIKISLDDFGSGYSTLSYVNRLPIDIIKIDKSLLLNLENDSKNQLIIKLIINMAHSLNIKVTAEGVETEAQLNTLKELQCDFVQGYLIGKPVVASIFEKLFIIPISPIENMIRLTNLLSIPEKAITN